MQIFLLKCSGSGLWTGFSLLERDCLGAAQLVLVRGEGRGRSGNRNWQNPAPPFPTHPPSSSSPGVFVPGAEHILTRTDAGEHRRLR